MRLSVSAGLLALVLLVGCGDDDADPCGPTAPCPGTDGGGTDGGSADVAAPMIDWLEAGEPPIAAPMLTPCPPGWREVPAADGEPATCDPYADAAGVGRCTAVDEAHYPGELGCARLGPVCPAGGGLPADLPTDRPIVHVLAGAAAGGDGSAGTPYADLTAFTPAASTVIAVGTGNYDAAISIPGAVSLVGACVAQTVLTSSTASDSAGVVSVTGDGSDIRALRIADAERPGVVVERAGRSVALDAVVVEGARLTGILVEGGAMLDANGVVVRDTRGRALNGDFGRGINVGNGSQARIARALLEGNRELSVAAVQTGTSLELSDSVVRETQPLATDLQYGRGVDVENGASASLQRVLVADNRDAGVFGLEADTAITLQDVVIRDTDSNALSRTSGRGLVAQLGVQLQASRVLIERNREHGVFSRTSDVDASDLVVRDATRQERDGVLGRGIELQFATTARIVRAVVARSFDSGIHASRAGTMVRLEDVVVRDRETEMPTGIFGRGVNAQTGARVEIVRALFERNHESGLYASDPDSHLSAEDVAVRDSQPNEAAMDFGRGVSIEQSASGRLTRVVLDRNRDSGVVVSADATLTFEDLVVRDTTARVEDGTGGSALFVQIRGTVDGVRARFERNLAVGVIGLSDSRVDLSDLWVGDTMEQECVVDTCPEEGGGSSAASVLESTMTLDRFVLTRAALCGIHVARGAGADLSNGEVSESQIGGCIQVDGFDPDRLTNMVEYRDNDVAISATDLPIPEPLSAIEPP